MPQKYDAFPICLLAIIFTTLFRRSIHVQPIMNYEDMLHIIGWYIAVCVKIYISLFVTYLI